MRAFLGVALFVCSLAMAQAQVVISQVYGGGGNSGAPLTHDFVELFNRGSAPVSLNGLSIQYASATGTGNFGSSSTQLTELPNVTLDPGKYFLVQQSGGSNGVPLPTPDFIDATSISMSATGGKVVLVTGTTSLGCNGGSNACDAAALARILDLVGFGSANFFEGSGATGAPSNTNAVLRNGAGCTDTNNNSADFTVGAPAPRNSSTPANVCGGPTEISGIGAANPASVLAGGSTLLTVTVTPGSNPTSTGITVQADLTAIGGLAAQPFLDDGANGDVTAGDNVFSFAATVAGGTATGQKALAFSIADAQSRTATGAINLTVTGPVILTRICDIQGPSITSPLVGQTVTAQGIVTGLRGNGFYIQSTGDEDSNPATSEGIFVFTGSGNVPATAVVGNKLEVTGVVVEFVSNFFPSYTAPPGSATLTELVAPLSYNLVSTGNTLPAPQVIDATVLSSTAMTPATRWMQLERFEGMRVTFSNFRVTQNTNSTTVFGTLSQEPIPYREPGVIATKFPTGTPAIVPVYDGNPEVVRVEGSGLNGGNASFSLPFGSTIASVTGIIDYSTSDGIYLLRTNAAGVSGLNPASLVATPLPEPAPSDFTVATTNVANFTSTNSTKMSKVSLAIRNVLRMPDVIGLQEVDTLSSLQALAAKIDADATAAGQTPPGYAAALLPGNASGVVGANNFQNVGFLYKPARFTNVGPASQFGTEDNTYVNPLDTTPPNTELTFDRPPLVISGVAKMPSSDSGVPVTVVVNHLKSLIDLDNATTDPGDGGLRNQTKRHYGARDTALLLQSLNTGMMNLVSVGDHNAYEFNDGYVDVVNCILGNPTAGNAMIYQPPSGDACLVADSAKQMVNLTSIDPAVRYSYNFLGSRQSLDHILVNQTAFSRVSCFGKPLLNSDFPGSGAPGNDATRPERYSDHDPQVVCLRLPNEVTSKVRVLASGLIYNRALGAFTGTVRVQNTGASTLAGPLYVFFQGLPSGVTLSNATGSVNGVPYIAVNASLNPGQISNPVSVRFTTTPATRVTYTTKTYSQTF